MSVLEGKTIAVLMGGLSPEREISLTTGKAVAEAMERKNLKGIPVDVDRNIAARLSELKPDMAFIGLHGTFGEDGTIQGILEYLAIPYTGSGVLGSSLAYNKVASKRIFEEADIPTAKWEVRYRHENNTSPSALPLPLVVKPSDQGSSIGVTIVRNEEEWAPALELAFALSEEVLIEEFIEGRLLAIGMNGETPLPIVEIKPMSGFYDYEAKYTPGKTEYVCPAPMTEKETRACEETAVRTFRALRGRGFPRVDVILSADGVPYVLEMNTIPGMTPTSLLPKAAREAGMEFEDLVVAILNTARLDLQEDGHS